MNLQSILDFCSKIEGCSGKITLARDEFYGLHAAIPDVITDETVVNCKQDHGYYAFCSVKDVLLTGRGLTPEEALQKLEEKLKAKFNV